MAPLDTWPVCWMCCTREAGWGLLAERSSLSLVLGEIGTAGGLLPCNDPDSE